MGQLQQISGKRKFNKQFSLRASSPAILVTRKRPFISTSWRYLSWQINSKCWFKGQGVTSLLKLSKFWVMQIFGQSSISIPNFTLQISSKLIFSCQYLVYFWLSQISACKYQSEKTITVFLPCTRAQGLKVRALSENSKNSLSRHMKWGWTWESWP